MLQTDMEVSLKVIIVGNGQVGKTSMLTRFCRGRMTDTYKKTIGTDFMEKEIDLKSGESCRFMLWDTAGQEMFAGLTKSYYRGSGAVVYVFSTIDRESFEAIHDWKAKVEAQCGGNLAAVLVQNKVDLIDEAKVSSEEVEALAKELGMKLYRTSVKSNLHVAEVFEHAAELFIANGGEQSIDSTMPELGMQTEETEAPPAPKNLDLSGPSTQRTGGKKAFCSIL